MAARRRAVDRDRRAGAAALEMALILPLLIPIVLFGVDFARFAYTDIAVANAAREAANYAALHPRTTATATMWVTAVEQAAKDDLGCSDPQSGFQAAKVVFSPPPTIVSEGTSGDQRAVVSVSYPFTTIVNWPALLYGPGVPNSMTLTKCVAMRVIQ